MSDVIRIDPLAIDRAALAPAADRLRSGGLVAFPTETVYGLGAHALDRAAVQRVFDVKGRPATDPLIVHVARVEDLTPLVSDVPEIAQVLALALIAGCKVGGNRRQVAGSALSLHF